MAGDWIKMRSNLWDDPRVTHLCDLTEAGEAAVIGGLYWLWATADQHSEDGILHGLTARSLDRKTGVSGFANALVSIGWLSDAPDGLRIERFDEHNGASAKTRAQTARRVSNHKSNAQVTPEPLPKNAYSNGDTVSSALPREEKRREEKIKAEANAIRLPDDWAPNSEEIAFCRRERPDLDVDSTADQFRDYWIAQPGAKGRKLDWHATWRNWVRNQRGGRPPQSDNRPRLVL
jgi:hypothetical protein